MNAFKHFKYLKNCKPSLSTKIILIQFKAVENCKNIQFCMKNSDIKN